MKLDLSKIDGITPGPWSANLVRRESNGPFMRANVSAGALFVCGLYGGAATDPISADEADSNAAAIAALPDLLTYARDLEAENDSLSAALQRFGNAELKAIRQRDRLAEALRDLADAADACDTRQHAGLTVSGIEWSELYRSRNFARSALASLDSQD